MTGKARRGNGWPRRWGRWPLDGNGGPHNADAWPFYLSPMPSIASPHGFNCRGLRGTCKKWPTYRTRVCANIGYFLGKVTKHSAGFSKRGFPFPWCMHILFEQLPTLQGVCVYVRFNVRTQPNEDSTKGTTSEARCGTFSIHSMMPILRFRGYPVTLCRVRRRDGETNIPMPKHVKMDSKMS